MSPRENDYDVLDICYIAAGVIYRCEKVSKVLKSTLGRARISQLAVVDLMWKNKPPEDDAFRKESGARDVEREGVVKKHLDLVPGGQAGDDKRTRRTIVVRRGRDERARLGRMSAAKQEINKSKLEKEQTERQIAKSNILTRLNNELIRGVGL